MICKSCAYAGDLLSSPEDVSEKIPELHSPQKCPGGTWCDCQHYVPERGANA